MSGTSGEWLVRSGGRILGPFEKSVIEDMLRSKELVVFDEVALPMSRWIYIRDNENFIQVVEELRSAEMAAAGPATQTETIRENTVTQTESSNYEIDEMTAEISTISESSEIVYEDIDESLDKIDSQARAFDSGGSGSAYGMASGAAVQKEVEKSTKGMWVFTASVILLVMAYIGYKNFYEKPKEQKAAAKADLTNARRAMMVGNENAALNYLATAQQVEPNNDQINLDLGIRLIQVEGQTVQGKRLLEGLVEGRFAKQAKIGIGLAEMIDGNYQRSIELFKAVLQVEPTYVDAHINWGVAEFERENYEGAALHFRDAFANRTSEGVAYLLYAESLIAQWQRTKDRKFLVQALGALNPFIRSSKDYLQEALLLKIYSLASLNSGKSLEPYILQFLNIDPQQTQDHKHNIYIDRRKVNWSILSHKCQFIADYMPESTNARALNAVCFIKAGESAKAISIIDDAVLRSAGHPLILAVSAYILFELGQVSEAEVAIGKAVELNRKMVKKFELPSVIEGRLREIMEDDAGAKDAWLRAFSINAKSLQAYAGLAKSFLKSGSPIQANKHVVDGLKIGPMYGPLLELKADLSQSATR